MTKFIISTDSSADLYADYLKQNNIYCITMKRIQNGQEIGEIYNSEREFDEFYEQIRKGELPTTTQLNSYELEKYFEEILEREESGDIIHISLSSGLSGTYDNAKNTAREINARLSDRQIYVVDSLIATAGVAMLVDRAIELRDNQIETQVAIREIERIREHQQGWAIVGSLNHLKRGGRISGIKATLGTMLSIKPVIAVTKAGRLAIESTQKGNKKAIAYVLDKIENEGVKVADNFFDKTLYLVRTSKSELYSEFVNATKLRFPKLKIKEMIVGPIVGTHLGDGCLVVIFEGSLRPDI